jgi:hypothetical protein
VALTNAFLKDLFHDPRPPIGFALDPQVGESFGFPSGHAQVATAMWLWLAYEIKRPWAWAVAIFIVAGVGFSRLYLGVHDVEDVVGGTLLGLASVVIYRGFVSDQFNFWHNLNPEIQVLAIAGLAPLVWIVWPADVVPYVIFGLIAFLVFWWVGRTIEERWIQYERHESWLFAGAAAAAGIVVMFAILKACRNSQPSLCNSASFRSTSPQLHRRRSVQPVWPGSGRPLSLSRHTSALSQDVYPPDAGKEYLGFTQ